MRLCNPSSHHNMAPQNHIANITAMIRQWFKHYYRQLKPEPANNSLASGNGPVTVKTIQARTHSVQKQGGITLLVASMFKGLLVARPSQLTLALRWSCIALVLLLQNRLHCNLKYLATKNKARLGLLNTHLTHYVFDLLINELVYVLEEILLFNLVYRMLVFGAGITKLATCLQASTMHGCIKTRRQQ